jgi:hypothetical protein
MATKRPFIMWMFDRLTMSGNETVGIRTAFPTGFVVLTDCPIARLRNGS